MKKINVSLKKAIKYVEFEKDDLILQYDENESYLNELPKKYKENHLITIVSLELALQCMKHVLKNKCIKELDEGVL